MRAYAAWGWPWTPEAPQTLTGHLSRSLPPYLAAQQTAQTEGPTVRFLGPLAGSAGARSQPAVHSGQVLPLPLGSCPTWEAQGVLESEPPGCSPGPRRGPRRPVSYVTPCSEPPLPRNLPDRPCPQAPVDLPLSESGLGPVNSGGRLPVEPSRLSAQERPCSGRFGLISRSDLGSAVVVVTGVLTAGKAEVH